jgi:hypothetical protein
MSSRELTEWMVYFAWKDKVQAIVREQGDKVSIDQVAALAWQAFEADTQ